MKEWLEPKLSIQSENVGIYLRQAETVKSMVKKRLVEFFNFCFFKFLSHGTLRVTNQGKFPDFL